MRVLCAGAGLEKTVSFAHASGPSSVDLNLSGGAQAGGAGNTLTINGQLQAVVASAAFNDKIVVGGHASGQVGSQAAGNLTQYMAVQPGPAGPAVRNAVVLPEERSRTALAHPPLCVALTGA